MRNCITGPRDDDYCVQGDRIANSLFGNMNSERCFYQSDCVGTEEGHVYILRLEKNRYYVGFSTEVETRIASHFLGNGAVWTKNHRPLEVVSVKPGDVLLETVTTIALMATHGFENVRGGRYCRVDMVSPPASLAKALKYKPETTGSAA